MTHSEVRAVRLFCFGSSLLLSSFLAGCAKQTPVSSATGDPIPLAVKHGVVHGGAQPVSGASIQLYAVGTTGDGSAATPLLTQMVTTDASGAFEITGDYTCPSAGSLVYLTATGGNPGLPQGQTNNALAMMSALGPCGNLTSSTYISVNELTTVAAVSGLSPFMSSYSSIGSATGDATLLANAFTLASYYANVATGTTPGLNVPVGTTVPTTQLNTLANILTSCVNSPGGVAGDNSNCGTLFAATAPAGGTAPKDVIAAALSMAQNPASNISTLFGLVPASPPFQPVASVAPPSLGVNLAATSGGLSVSVSSLTFPPTYLFFSEPSATITLTNTGTTLIGLNEIYVIGLNAKDFSSSSGCQGFLAAGGTCTLQVVFEPLAAGARSAYLAIQSSAANSPNTIPLSAQGIAGTVDPLALSPASLTFTQAGVPQNVIVTNNGSAPVLIGRIIPSDSLGATETDNCGTMLAAQSICTIAVQVNGLSTQASTGGLEVINSSTNPTPTVQLVVPAASAQFSATPLAFGSWAAGVTSPAQSVQFFSGSTYTPIPAISASITGPNAGDFAISTAGNPSQGTGSCMLTTIVPSVCKISVTFTPTGTGLRTATLTTGYGNVALSGTGIAPGASFTMVADPPTLSAIVGSSNSPGTSTITVTNNGSTQLALSQPVLSGANAGDFALTDQCGPTLNASATCTLSAKFTPLAAGQRSATLTLTDTASGLSNSIALNGTASPMVPALSPASLTFGNTQVGSVSAPQTVTVSQQNGDPVTIKPYYGNTGDFAVSSQTCAQTPCQFSVTFQPTATGSRQAYWNVTDSITGETGMLTLQGAGGVATVSLSQTSVTFPARDEGTTSIPTVITLANTGNTTLLISGISLNGANIGDFPIEGNTCGSNVAAGANCTVSISFDPTSSGIRNANLVVQSNAASSPDMVQLSGTGN